MSKKTVFRLVIFVVMICFQSVSFSQDEDRFIEYDETLSDVRPQWAPSGEYIGFVSWYGGEPNIWVVRPDGSGLAHLTEADDAPNVEFSIAPNSDLIAYTSDTPEFTDIRVFHLNTLEDIGLRQSFGDDLFPILGGLQWSPDGRYISFLASGNDRTKLVLYDVEAGQAVDLTSEAGVLYNRYTWSPDSEHLMVAREIVEDGRITIEIISLDGERETLIYDATLGMAFGCVPLSITEIDWSIRDLLLVGFSCPNDAQGEFHVLEMAIFDLDGKLIKQLTNDDSQPLEGVNASWSPSGDRIVFQSEGNYPAYVNDTTDVLVTAVEDWQTINLTFDRIRHNGFAAWSPDGSKIAFEATEGNDIDIWVMDADGTNRRNLTPTDQR